MNQANLNISFDYKSFQKHDRKNIKNVVLNNEYEYCHIPRKSNQITDQIMAEDPETNSEPYQISKMERYAKIVND